LQFALTTIGIS